jgi:predicted outer membrane repeat protein
MVNSITDTASPTDPYLSLREAVAIVNSPSLPSGLSAEILAQISGPLHAGGADSIVFDPDQVNAPITLAGTPLELSLPSGTTAVTIDGGPAGVTVDGNNASRVLQVDSGVQATLDHLTLTHGRATSPGGGISSQGTLTVNNGTFLANLSTRDGGGIYSTGTLTVSDTALLANTSDSFGGGIFSSGMATVDNCTLGGNSVTGAGAGIENQAVMTVTGSTLRDNIAAGLLFTNGGAIANDTNATLIVTDCTMHGNSVNNGGGGLYNNGTLTVSNSTLDANDADYGGGIINFATLSLSNSTLGSNNSTHQGGGLYNYLGSARVDGSTLSGNTAAGGGGIYHNPMFPGSVTLHGTLVAGNHSTTSSGTDLSGAVVGTSSYNLVGVGDSSLSGISDGVEHNRIGTTAHPIDPRLTPPGYYGGPTQTFALLPGSPALGTGDPTTTLANDQRGLPRLVSGMTDIGAFQTQADPFLVTTRADPGRQYGQLSLREAVNLANILPGAHAISFDPTLDGGAIILTAGQLELSATGGVLTLDGASRFTIDGNAATRLFQIHLGTQAVVRGFDLGDGNAVEGGAVLNRGNLTVDDCTLWGDIADYGGAISNAGVLTLSSSTVEFDIAGLGAGILNGGQLIAYNSTFVYNSAITAGGAIFNAPGGTATLTSLTISRNSANVGGGLDFTPGGGCCATASWRATTTPSPAPPRTSPGRCSRAVRTT